jgi:hypothetical protein
MIRCRLFVNESAEENENQSNEVLHVIHYYIANYKCAFLPVNFKLVQSVIVELENKLKILTLVDDSSVNFE